MVYIFREHDPAVETSRQWWDRTKKWKTAYHEAGHAWAGTHHGWYVRLVTLDPQVHGNPNRNGLTVFCDYLPPMPIVIRSYMAGKVCERLVLPRGLWGMSEMGGYDLDVETAHQYLKKHCGVTTARQRNKFIREDEAYVRALASHPAHRSEIDRLAEALMESQTLTGPQVRAILGPYRGNGGLLYPTVSG